MRLDVAVRLSRGVKRERGFRGNELRPVDDDADFWASAEAATQQAEEDAFWTLVALLKGAVHAPLEGIYSEGLPLLAKCLHQFEGLLRAQLPDLGEHLTEENIIPTMYCVACLTRKNDTTEKS